MCNQCQGRKKEGKERLKGYEQSRDYEGTTASELFRSNVRLKFKKAKSFWTANAASSPLTHQRGLFERDEHRSHPGNILGLFVGFRIKVAQSGHPFPFRSCAAAVALGQEGLLRCSAGGKAGEGGAHILIGCLGCHNNKKIWCFVTRFTSMNSSH